LISLAIIHFPIIRDQQKSAKKLQTVSNGGIRFDWEEKEAIRVPMREHLIFQNETKGAPAG